MTTERLLERFQRGDRRACGRVMSEVEAETENAASLLDELFPLTGRAWRIGMTGPPGAGKSTLVARLAGEFRRSGRTVGIVAVDPTSPFTGGAVLGDRVRMTTLFTDPGVFIRSMATRGSLGGLAVRTREVTDVMDAFGQDIIIIETVGVGQMELDVADAVHSTVVVLVPESGDAIQTLKAGLMEIGDLFCVNKSDREGSDRMVMEIESMLELRPRTESWMPPVLTTVATLGTGLDKLKCELERHHEHLVKSGGFIRQRARSVRQEICRLVEQRLTQRAWSADGMAVLLDAGCREVMAGASTPCRVAEGLLEHLRGIVKKGAF
ncbi:MAG: methylmalonyl Co-A mutase-associated GTPase MeaB [candidate division WOR-3 bacterium]